MWSRERVAPHAGAWIETVTRSRAVAPVSVAPHAGAWIETIANEAEAVSAARRPPRGGVD